MAIWTLFFKHRYNRLHSDFSSSLLHANYRLVKVWNSREVSLVAKKDRRSRAWKLIIFWKIHKFLWKLSQVSFSYLLETLLLVNWKSIANGKVENTCNHFGCSTSIGLFFSVDIMAFDFLHFMFFQVQ